LNDENYLAMLFGRLVVILTFVLQPVLSVYGVDLEDLVVIESFECMKKSGNHQFAIISVGTVGRYEFFAPLTIRSAEEASLSVDGTVDLCMTCGAAEAQVLNLTGWLKEKAVSFRTLWINFEDTALWSDINTENIQFVEQLKVALAKNSLKWGIRTSKVAWERTMGDYKGTSSLPLWEAFYDGIPSFSGFISFGGWSRPTIKRYLAEMETCDVEFGANWRTSI